ncbi:MULTISPECIES: phage tail sheath C-terminal domain-containing protein [Nostoc]|uniref:phage tail sheath C-terminal domain-containing protein n=1 Tax=Nostoc TaxID=1177 RepID=UPI0018F04102|nr:MULTISPECIES: phage tail sheath C-terminal domain-containing protein [Nostoc]
MPTYKTPGVYVEEISVFPPSVAEVETAIPAFIGYTEIAKKNADNDLILKPSKIYSLKEYEQYFGYPKDDEIKITIVNGSAGGFAAGLFIEPDVKYLLYYSVKIFFDNGGGQCYIISVGTYNKNSPVINLTGDASSFGLQNGLNVLALEDEPTLIVIPEAVKLSTAEEYQTLVQAVLTQCAQLGDRFAIFDIYDGKTNLDANQLSTNRVYFGNNNLKYGAAYYPFVTTTINFYLNDGETNAKVTPPPAAGATVIATISPVGKVDKITIDSAGTGYTSAPTVVLTGGAGTGATARATLSPGVVTGITITTGGTGYTSAPTVVLTGGGGTGATATATVSGGAVDKITIDSGGTGYTTAPTISFTDGGGTGATATATIGGVTGITIDSGGTGYTTAPTISFTGGGGTGATATATVSPGKVTSIAVDSGGTGYASAPTVEITGGGGSGATATATVSAGAVTAIAVTKGGTGYASAPTISLTGGSGSQASLDTFKTSNTALYNFVKSVLKEHFVKLPPSGAVVGVYATTDNNRGVWKAPANVSLASVIEPMIRLDNARQDVLNVDATTGKSINAIRAFMGKGTLVWGARTLAGNDNEWRYVPVRRFFNMVEESVKKSTYWAVFEPNNANTWVKTRGMIESYLTQKWREGALAGATPKDAFFVKCGLGTTMTAQDILEGRMNVEIGMAVVRPAEFIILKFSHKLQTS